MKKIATVSIFTIVLVACSSAISYSDDFSPIPLKKPVSEVSVLNTFLDAVSKRKAEQTALEEEAAILLELKIKKAEKTKVRLLHKEIIENRIEQLGQYIGQTRYVLSGSTPRGWDCSGLVVWFYKELGIELPHSATKQGLLKPKTKNPLPGDIVVFKYKNSKSFIHSGIYIGNNQIIHSGFKPGQKTEIINLDDPSFENQKHYFVRVIGD